MREPRFLFGLIFVMLGSIWTLQGVDVVDGMIFGAKAVAVAAGVVTTIVGVVIMAWGRRRQP